MPTAEFQKSSEGPCVNCRGANKDKESFGLPKRGLLTKCQYCTGMCILWCLLVNCSSGGKWLLYTVALVALTFGVRHERRNLPTKSSIKIFKQQYSSVIIRENSPVKI